MKKEFTIAIIGRPNVGKSSLFNRIVGKRRSIVDAMPGVTRDIIDSVFSIRDRSAVLLDTGGYFEGTDNAIEEGIRRQIHHAVELADFLVFLVDIAEGVHPMDKTVLEIIKKSRKPFVMAANKADNESKEQDVFAFFTLGTDNVIPVSSLHGRGIKDLLEILYQKMPSEPSPEEKVKHFKICIVGKPNVGKSSLINALLDEERVIVTDIPGTTRDEIDISYNYDGQDLLFIDTAGLRKSRAVMVAADQFGISRTQTNIERADLNILVIDPSQDITVQDKRIGDLIVKSGKACLIVVNKEDLYKENEKAHIRNTVGERLQFLGFAPVIFISAKEKRNIRVLLQNIISVKEKLEQEIETVKLNKELQRLQEKYIPATRLGKKLNIYYAVQTNKIPLEMLVFINDRKNIVESYISYIKNNLRKRFGLNGIPINFRYRIKKDKNKVDF
jgi:GTPase